MQQRDPNWVKTLLFSVGQLSPAAASHDFSKRLRTATAGAPCNYSRQQRLQGERPFHCQVLLEQLDNLILAVQQLGETLHVGAELMLKTDVTFWRQ